MAYIARCFDAAVRSRASGFRCRSARVSTKPSASCQPPHGLRHTRKLQKISLLGIPFSAEQPRLHASARRRNKAGSAQPSWATPHLSHFQKVCSMGCPTEAIMSFRANQERLQISSIYGIGQAQAVSLKGEHVGFEKAAHLFRNMLWGSHHLARHRQTLGGRSQD